MLRSLPFAAIHSTGAVVFFLGFILYMCLVTRRLAKSSHVVNPTSLHFKYAQDVMANLCLELSKIPLLNVLCLNQDRRLCGRTGDVCSVCLDEPELEQIWH